jgi:hypothetical protein
MPTSATNTRQVVIRRSKGIAPAHMIVVTAARVNESGQRQQCISANTNFPTHLTFSVVGRYIKGHGTSIFNF